MQKFFSYLLDSRAVGTALKMCSCCTLERKWQWFETLAGVAEKGERPAACTWSLLQTSGLLERQLHLEKLGKPQALGATQENPARLWKRLESNLNLLVKWHSSGMRSTRRSKQRNCLDHKVAETVLQSAVLQWVQNKVKQGLRKGVFTGNDRQYEEPTLYNFIWEDHLCSKTLHPEIDCILTPEHTATATVAVPKHCCLRSIQSP